MFTGITLGQAVKNPSLILNKSGYYGFYDWFCKDSSLEARAKRLFAKAKKVAKSSKVNAEGTYLWFKNCDCCTGTYDSLRISDKDSGEVLYSINPPHGDDAGELWGTENGFEEPLVTGSMKDIYNYFGV